MDAPDEDEELEQLKEELDDFLGDLSRRNEDEVFYNLRVEIASAVTSLDRARLYVALSLAGDAIDSADLLSSEGIHPGMYAIGHHSQLATAGGNRVPGAATALTIAGDGFESSAPDDAGQSQLWAGQASVSESLSQGVLLELLKKDVIVKSRTGDETRMKGIEFALCYQRESSGGIGSMSLLHHACLYNDRHALGTLIGMVREANRELEVEHARSAGELRESEKISVDARDAISATPLHYASALPGEAGEAFVYALLHADADENVADSYQATPLHWAARANNVGVVKLLLGKKANAAAEMVVAVRGKEQYPGSFPHELTTNEEIYAVLFDECREQKRREEIRRAERASATEYAADGNAEEPDQEAPPHQGAE